MDEKIKNKLIIAGAIGYIILAIIITMFLPNILSLGKGNVEMILTTGQTAAITMKEIDVTNADKPVKNGDKIYILKGVDDRIVISHKKQDNAIMGRVVDVIGSRAKVEMYYNTSQPRFTPGIKAFQGLFFVLLITIPIVVLAKNDMLTGFSFDFGGGGSNKFLRSKTKYGNQGTAKEGTISELRGLTGKDGFSISKGVRLSAAKSYEHVMVLGPTGSGKSTSFFIPNLLDLDGIHSAVVTDPKGELHDLTSPYLESLGYNIIKLEPLRPERNEFFYNPLSIVEDATGIRDVAQLILTNGNKAVEISTGSSSGGAEWINMSIPLLAASFAYIKKFGKQKSIPEAINIILHDDLKQMEAKFRKCDDAFKMFLIFKQSTESEKTLSSIKSVLTTNVQLFVDPKIAKFVSPPLVYNENGERVPDEERLLDPRILRDRPTVLFVCVPESKSTMMMPLMSVFFTQLLDVTMEYNQGSPILYMLDEFANIGVIPSIATVTATARSRRIGVSVGIQGVEQLRRNYGEENASDIMNNLKTKLIYSGLTGDSAQYVSDLAGVTTIETKSYSTNSGQGQDFITNLVAGKNVSVSGTRRELITPDEVRRMPEDQVLIIAHNRNPVFDKKNTYYTQQKYKQKV
jgi:type IV secretion system protein VirD4